MTATSSNTALIPNPTVTYTSPDATGSLSYQPVANQSGTAVITVTVRDAGLDGVLGNDDDGTVEPHVHRDGQCRSTIAHAGRDFRSGGDQRGRRRCRR